MIGLSGCAYNGLYSGVSVGVGNGGYYDPYYDAYGYGYGAGYSRYGYGYGFDPYWGWNDGFYYPGTGYYVYDRYRRAHRWTDAQRRHWEQRRQQTLASGFRNIATNWTDFDRSSATTQRVRSVDSPVQVERSIERQGRIERGGERQGRIERIIENRRVRAERQASQAETRSSVRVQRQSETRASSSNSDHSSRGRGRNRDGNKED
jgi:hypothetical protein